MTIGFKQERIPHVRFEQKDWGRNETASRESGVHVPNRSTFIFVTSHGSKDSSEFIADEWLVRKRDEASRGNYNLEWVEYFEKQYKAWKDGHELPREGTAILTWQACSAEQSARLRALGYQVVEDVAAIPDTGLGQLGLDGRVIRDMARAWLAEGKDKGINTRLVAEQAAKIDTLEQLVTEMRAELNELRPKRKDKAA